MTTLTSAEAGELNVLLGRHLNTKGDGLTNFLYRPPPAGCGFPSQFIKEGGRNTDREARSKEALLALYRKYPKDRRIELCLKLSDLRTQLEGALSCKLDADHRIRCSVNIVGTETQRHTTYESNTGSGYALHTVNGRHKHLFLADEGHWLFSIDLSGADGWTIAAECAALGDRRMLDDLLNGLKPAQAICLLYQHGAAANGWDYPQLLVEAAKIDKRGWLYMAFKKGIWGYCYGMGEQKQITVIMEESYKETGTPLFVELSVIKSMRKCIDQRYPGVRRRQERIRMLLARDGALTCANGSRRTFFGRKDDHATLKEAYAHHPQVMTTYTLSLAWRRLWTDVENWASGVVGTGDPTIQPLLLVHDSLMGQFPQARTEWACGKLRGWFDNPVIITGTTVTVPYSGGYGPNWGQLDVGMI